MFVSVLVLIKDYDSALNFENTSTRTMTFWMLGFQVAIVFLSVASRFKSSSVVGCTFCLILLSTFVSYIVITILSFARGYQPDSKPLTQSWVFVNTSIFWCGLVTLCFNICLTKIDDM